MMDRAVPGRFVGRAFGFVMAVATGLVAACVSRPPMTIVSFTLDPPPLKAPVPHPNGVVVSLARVRVAPPYSGTEFVYRLGGHRIERDVYAVFAAPPGWMMTTALRGYLRNADFIGDVVEPGGEVPVRATIEVDVNELYADLPDGKQATAVLAMSFRVYRSPTASKPEKEIFRKTYSRSRDIGERDADDIADAWNKALSEIADEFVSDLRPPLPPAS